MKDLSDDLNAILRFVSRHERRQALDAVAYAGAMLGDLVPTETVEAWCYELAASGVPYQDWPELVALRHSRGNDAGSDDATSLQRARTASAAMGIVDYGEI